MTEWRWKNFSKKEMSCKHCGKHVLNEDFMDKLQSLRDIVGVMLVTSGYRCPEYNNKISTTGFNGSHTTGCAADIDISGQKARRLVKYANDFPGLGVYQNGGAEFIHIDTLGERIWSK